MKANKLDSSIQQKLVNRTLQPSVSAWERLSNQLDVQEKGKKKKRFLYLNYAASILLLISLGFFIKNDDKNVSVKSIITLKPVDVNFINKHIDFLKRDIRIIEKAVVYSKKQVKSTKKENLFTNKSTNAISEVKVENEENTIVKSAIPLKYQKLMKENKIASEKASGININSNYLLYAVTHTKEEVAQYYSKYNIDRNKMLKSVQQELDKIGLKVNPETILAEAERTIDEDNFQNNFIKSIKKSVANIATAISSRNH